MTHIRESTCPVCEKVIDTPLAVCEDECNKGPRWEFFLNWTGPINSDFIREHGYEWSGGRIDCSDLHGIEQFGTEIAVPLMSNESWKKFGGWLRGLATSRLPGYNELVRLFEEETGNVIEEFESVHGDS